VLCEDIRVEYGGKHSLLGVYAGDIIVPELKNFLKVALFIELYAKELGEFDLEGKIIYADSDVLGFKLQMKYEDVKSPALLVSPSFPVPLNLEGEILVMGTCKGKTSPLLSKTVRVGDVPSGLVAPNPTASP
jgi:hypothetical protein